jgi:hypothetical protein
MRWQQNSPKRTAQLILTSLAILVAGGITCSAEVGKKPTSIYKTELAAEGKSQALCESVHSRIYVANAYGSECVSYFVTQGYEAKRDAVIVFDGDVSEERYIDPQTMQSTMAKAQKALQSWANRLKVRYVMVSRLGVLGSSGNHGERRRPREAQIMNSAIDILKTRLGINRFALAGQSGGSTISAALLALGRKDIACAALGSGAFELLDLEYKRLRANGRMVSKMALANAIYDPSSHVANIPADMSRRIFIIGDTTEKRYAEALQAAGHHALLIPIEAIGDLDHSAMAYVVPTAGGCLRGTPDDKLVIANAKKSRNTETTELAATQSATGRTALPRPGENTER